MSKPAARVGDMHVCPFVTPGVPPIPHVGGPVTGPGCPTVMIGGMPAAVMGDMCVCTGPPDTIILGSMGVMIGGKPAARMGDTCMHGGTIVVGCPTVLIGEMSPDGMNKMSPVVNAFMLELEEFEAGAAAGLAVRQTMSLKKAAADGVPFCEICEAKKGTGATSGGKAEKPEENKKEEEEVKTIEKLYFADASGNEITEVDTEESVFLVIESKSISGEEVIINLTDQNGDFTYQGEEIENNQLTVSVQGDEHKVELGVKINS
ncbi:MAG: PAAR domain-containing protein [Flavobacteriales bacterium]|nr:PAAR domain-containing protein [Flavobacteriales bacterium]